MDGYTVDEAAEVLGIPGKRVWELITTGVLAASSEGRSGMRVFLQPRTPTDMESALTGEPRGSEATPFRELLTEFRNLTERYGQALLALGEARGEVASLRGRVELLEARIDVRHAPARIAPVGSWPSAPSPADDEGGTGLDEVSGLAPPAEEQEVDLDKVSSEAPPPPEQMAGADAEEPDGFLSADSLATVSPDETDGHSRRRGRSRSGHAALADIAAALARAEDPSAAELRDAMAEEAAVAEPDETAAVTEPDETAAVAESDETAAVANALDAPQVDSLGAPTIDEEPAVVDEEPAEPTTPLFDEASPYTTAFEEPDWIIEEDLWRTVDPGAAESDQAGEDGASQGGPPEAEPIPGLLEAQPAALADEDASITPSSEVDGIATGKVTEASWVSTPDVEAAAEPSVGEWAAVPGPSATAETLDELPEPDATPEWEATPQASALAEPEGPAEPEALAEPDAASEPSTTDEALDARPEQEAHPESEAEAESATDSAAASAEPQAEEPPEQEASIEWGAAPQAAAMAEPDGVQGMPAIEAITADVAFSIVSEPGAPQVGEAEPSEDEAEPPGDFDEFMAAADLGSSSSAEPEAEPDYAAELEHSTAGWHSVLAPAEAPSDAPASVEGDEAWVVPEEPPLQAGETATEEAAGPSRASDQSDGSGGDSWDASEMEAIRALLTRANAIDREQLEVEASTHPLEPAQEESVRQIVASGGVTSLGKAAELPPAKRPVVPDGEELIVDLASPDASRADEPPFSLSPRLELPGSSDLGQAMAALEAIGTEQGSDRPRPRTEATATNAPLWPEAERKVWSGSSREPSTAPLPRIEPERAAEPSTSGGAGEEVLAHLDFGAASGPPPAMTSDRSQLAAPSSRSGEDERLEPGDSAAGRAFRRLRKIFPG
jgi:hypothetical protein